MLRDIPNDPFILLSFINTKLRDNYANLTELCEDLNVAESDITTRLASLGYIYDPVQNKFV